MGLRERSKLREILYNKSPEDKWLILGKELKKLIRKKAKIKEGNMLDVTKFLNHDVSPIFRFFGETIADAYIQKYREDYVKKVLTVESSGNIFAGNTGFEFYKYITLAKKKIPATLKDEELYSSEVESYTKGEKKGEEKVEKKKIFVEKSVIKRGYRILIVDDFIATGSATFALIDIIEQAGAELAGIVALITKDFEEQDGYKGLKKYIKEYNLNHKDQASVNTFVKIKKMGPPGPPKNIKYGECPLILN